MSQLFTQQAYKYKYSNQGHGLGLTKVRVGVRGCDVLQMRRANTRARARIILHLQHRGRWAHLFAYLLHGVHHLAPVGSAIDSMVVCLQASGHARVHARSDAFLSPDAPGLTRPQAVRRTGDSRVGVAAIVGRCAVEALPAFLASAGSRAAIADPMATTVQRAPPPSTLGPRPAGVAPAAATGAHAMPRAVARAHTLPAVVAAKARLADAGRPPPRTDASHALAVPGARPAVKTAGARAHIGDGAVEPSEALVARALRHPVGADKAAAIPRAISWAHVLSARLACSRANAEARAAIADACAAAAARAALISRQGAVGARPPLLARAHARVAGAVRRAVRGALANVAVLAFPS